MSCRDEVDGLGNAEFIYLRGSRVNRYPSQHSYNETHTLHFSWLGSTHYHWAFVDSQNLCSVSNGSGKPASGVGLERKRGLDWSKTCPTTWPTASYESEPQLVTITPQVWLGLARPVGSNLLFCVSCVSIYSCIQISNWKSQNINFGTSQSFFDILTAFIIKTNIDTLPAPSWKRAPREGQRFSVLHPR